MAQVSRAAGDAEDVAVGVEHRHECAQVEAHAEVLRDRHPEAAGDGERQLGFVVEARLSGLKRAAPTVMPK